MPEGPEVRHNADLLSKLIDGKRITQIKPISGKLLKAASLLDFAQARVKEVKAYGKLIVIRFDTGAVLTSTLGMSGWWYPPRDTALRLYSAVRAYQQGKLIMAAEVIDKALKHSRVALMDGETELAIFTDPRNFGNMELRVQGMSQDELDARIGLDLLSELPRMHELDPVMTELHLLQLKSTATKRLQNMRLGDLALEQQFIAGLGNIYRAEAIWLSGLDPHSKLSQLSDDDWLWFCEISMIVLQIAYQTAGMMRYSADLIKRCTGVEHQGHNGHLAYGRSADIFGRPIICDNSFNRTLWRAHAPHSLCPWSSVN